VAKVGSAGSQVRRIQRALNASTLSALKVTGVYDAPTAAAVRIWQAKVDVSVTGVLSARQWLTLQAGAR
jgi:peptidoglycan hydrolase-like protein with peptidoglycan-binding domain